MRKKQKKRGNKKKSGRGGGGDRPSASPLGDESEDRVVEQQSLTENEISVPITGSATSSSLPRIDEEREASSTDDTEKESLKFFQSFMDPAFADRVIGDLLRMGEEAKKQECWICLSDDVDESGRSPVRDCSCRGDGLGYAHIDCIKAYARRASLDMNEGLSDKLLPADEQFEARRFNVHWEKCSICCQSFQHELAKELADTLLQFIAEKFIAGPLITSYKIPSLDELGNEKYRDACRMKIAAITTMDYHSPELRKEGEETARKLLAISYIEDDPHPLNVAIGLKKIGFFLGASKDTYKEGIKFYEKAIEQYKSMGKDSSIAIAQWNIERIRIENEGKSHLSEEDRLKNESVSFNYFVKNEGEESLMGIKAGMSYAQSLAGMGHGIEGERLATKTFAICSRVLGKMHDITRRGWNTEQYCKARRVKMVPETNGDAVAIRYEDNGRKLVVRNKEGRMMEGSSRNVIFWNGTPVVCHSLKDSASHLNGKIGDARNYNKEDGKYTVHFEDKSLKPVAIKGENLSIVFELPLAPKQVP